MGIVFDIQRFCVHDGPGLRTTVFLKGCPLRCRWCSNPESLDGAIQLMYNASRCMGCGFCVKSCPNGIITKREDTLSIDRQRCAACGECIKSCPTAALILKGREMTAAEVEAEVLKDADVFKSSGGGVTVSGGEPFAQADFLRKLLERFRSAGLETAVETSMVARWEDIERCLPFLSLALCDLKSTDAALLAKWTGGNWERVEKNITAMLSCYPNVLIRIPVVPGFNTDEKSFTGFASFLQRLGVCQVELLPYHFLGEGKYAMLGMEYGGSAIDGGISYNDSLRFKEYLMAKGIHAIING